MRYHGTLTELQAIVVSTGRKGTWSELHNNGDICQFRAQTGEILNWACEKGTIWFQGRNQTQFESDIQRELENFSAQGSDRIDPRQTIFIVHGHDEEARNQLELALRRMNLDPFILQNNDGDGMTIIEALERHIYSNASFGIVLMTPDDFGYSKESTEAERQPRARQNVILEMGMVLAALGRDRTLILKKGALEAPSDTHGILYAPFNGHIREVIPNLVQRLRRAGFDITAEQMAAAQK